jgi:hypothetical protein
MDSEADKDRSQQTGLKTSYVPPQGFLARLGALLKVCSVFYLGGEGAEG